MRFLLLSVLFVGSAFAQTAERELIDLMYLPKAGTIYGETALNFEGTEYNQNKNELQVTTHNMILSQDVGFSFTDSLSVGVQYEQQLKGEAESDNGATPGGTTTVDTEGTRNPTLKGTFRLMDQASSSHTLDILAAYSPDLIDLEGSDNDEKFTASYGGATYKVGARWGQKNGTSHWNFAANLKVLGEAEAKLDSGEKRKKDSSYDVDVSYNFQENMLPWLDFRAHVGLTRVGGYDVKDDTDTAEVDPNWVGDLGVKFLVSPIKDTLVVYAAMGGFWSKGYDVDTGGTKDEIRDYKGWKGSVGALYQF